MLRTRFLLSVALVLPASSAPLLPSPAGAQDPVPEWTYLTEAPGQAEALATGPGGDILAAGTSNDGSASDILVIRLPPTGPPPTWIAVANQAPTDQVSRSRSGFIVDAGGTCYLAGSIRHPGHDDFFVLQVRSNGVPGWTYGEHGNSYNIDGAQALALDPNGGALYAAGSVYGAGLLVQLDAETGEPQWGYAQPGALFYDVAVDPAGDAYVAGGPVVKVNSAGTQAWAYSYPSTFFRVVILDAAGNVYAAGAEFCGQYCRRMRVVKLSPRGVEQWSSAASGFPYDLLLDEAGNVYAVGTGTDGSEGPIGTIARFAAATGNVDWAHGFDGPTGADLTAIARRGNRVLAAGSVYGGLPEQNQLWLVQFNQETGALDWIYRHPRAAGSDVVVGTDGAVYVCGTDLTSHRFLVEKLTGVTGIDGVRAQAEAAPGGILVSWMMEPSARFAGFHLERGETSEGPFDRIEWVEIERVEEEGGRFAYLDRAVEPGRTYYYRIVAVRADGSEVSDPDFLIVRVPDVSRIAIAIAPNPVRAGAEVRFEAPPAGGRVRLDLLDVAGRLVRTLVEGDFPGGMHREPWDAGGVPPGTYLLRVRTAESSAATKVVVLERP